MTEVEPWLQGTLSDVGAVQRGVLHALLLATEDIQRWCGPLTDSQLNARPFGIAPVAFHLRHIARSLDRLLTYAESAQLSTVQLAALKSEMEEGARKGPLLAEFHHALEDAARRVRAISPVDLESDRQVGRKALPSSVGGLLVHIAEHTQRHVGQAIVTAKLASQWPERRSGNEA